MITQNICHEPECNINTEDFPSIDKQNLGNYCYFHSIEKVIRFLHSESKKDYQPMLQEQANSVIKQMKLKAQLIPSYESFVEKFEKLLQIQENREIQVKRIFFPLNVDHFGIKFKKQQEIQSQFIFSEFGFYNYDFVKELLKNSDWGSVRNSMGNIIDPHSKKIELENLKFVKPIQFITKIHNLVFKKCDFETGLEILACQDSYEKQDVQISNSVELANDCIIKEKLKIETNKLTISNCTISCDEVELAVPFERLTLENPIYKEYLFKDSELIEIYDGVKGEPQLVNGKPTGSCEHVDVRNILFHDTTLENKQNGYSKQIIDNLSKIKFANCLFNKNHTLYDNYYFDYSNTILDIYLITDNKFLKLGLFLLGLIALIFVLIVLETIKWDSTFQSLFGTILPIVISLIFIDILIIRKITSTQLFSLLIEVILSPFIIIQEIINSFFIIHPQNKSTKTHPLLLKLKNRINFKTLDRGFLYLIPKILTFYPALMLVSIFAVIAPFFVILLLLFFKYFDYNGKNYKTILEKYKNKENIFKRHEFSYLHLREHYDSQKDYLAASDFQYNYMEVKRRNTQSSLDKLILLFYGYVNGYNTKPWRTFLWLMILPFAFTLVFGLGMNWYNLSIQTGIGKDNNVITINIQNEQDWYKKFEYLLGYNYRNITFLNILKDSDIYKTNDATTLLLTSSENALALVLITLGIPAFYNRYRRNKSDSGGEVK